ncbi:MAG: condensation domain-containing protein [Acidimicrobiales bacterium]
MPEFVDVPPLASQVLGIVSAGFSPGGLSDPEWIVSICISLEGPLDYEVLRLALQQLAARHELLRARLTTEHGRPWVRISETVSLDLTVRLLEDTAAAESLQTAREHARRHAELPIDPGASPTWRVLVVEVGPSVHLLSFVAHHLFVDGWSLELVAHDIVSLYNSHFDQTEELELEPATSYQSYVATQERSPGRPIDEWLESEVLTLPPMPTPQLRLTRTDRLLSATIRRGFPVRWGFRLLRTKPMLSVLKRRLVGHGSARPDASRRPSRSSVDTTVSSVVTSKVRVGAEATTRLRVVTRSLRTTEAVVLGALVLKALHDTFGRDDVWAWSLSGGRTSAEELNLVGNFPDIFPICAHFGDDPAFEDVVQDVRSAFVRFYSSGGFCAPWTRPEEALTRLLTKLSTQDLAHVVDLLIDPRDLRVFYDVSPRSTVAGVVDTGPGPEARPGRLSWRHEDLPGGPDKDPAGCQLGVRFSEDEGALEFAIQYDARHLPADLVGQFSAQLLRSVDDLAGTGPPIT